MTIKRLDHVSIVADDLATARFALEPERAAIARLGVALFNDVSFVRR